jgi:hypothetical protein
MFYGTGPRLKVTDTGQQCNLLRYGITYGRKKLYKIGSWGLSHKKFWCKFTHVFCHSFLKAINFPHNGYINKMVQLTKKSE